MCHDRGKLAVETLLLGSAESAAADFFQAPLMVSFSSLLMCWIAYGWTLSRTVPACLYRPAMLKTVKSLAQAKSLALA